MSINSRSAAIPVRAAWSSPFVRWQGALSEISSLDLAAEVTTKAFAERNLDPTMLTRLVLGWTVPQKDLFYGASTLAAQIGAPTVSGPMVSQACATGAVSVEIAAARVQQDQSAVVAVVTTDRTSNGPVLTYPSPGGPGGAPRVEHWVLDNFKRDPWAGKAMVQTAEKVAAEAGIGREELDELTLLRHAQYATALADDRAFQRRYMVDVELPSQRGPGTVVEADEGVFATTAEGLAALRPVEPDGVVTFGSQTHPADGTAGLIVTSGDRAATLAEGGPVAQILGTGQSRVAAAEMPKAPVPAAAAALKAAGLDWGDVDAVTMHDPFAVNDVYFSQQTQIPAEKINERGSSLIFGHPQGPTGTRLIIELMHRLVERGGGVGLFTGCAAGDSGAAVVLRVE